MKDVFFFFGGLVLSGLLNGVYGGGGDPFWFMCKRGDCLQLFISYDASFVLSTAVGGAAYPDRGLACFVVGVVALYLLVCAKHRRLLIMGFIRDVILFVRVAGLMRPAYDVLGSFKTVMRGIERD